MRRNTSRRVFQVQYECTIVMRLTGKIKRKSTRGSSCQREKVAGHLTVETKKRAIRVDFYFHADHLLHFALRTCRATIAPSDARCCKRQEKRETSPRGPSPLNERRNAREKKKNHSVPDHFHLITKSDGRSLREPKDPHQDEGFLFRVIDHHLSRRASLCFSRNFSVESRPNGVHKRRPTSRGFCFLCCAQRALCECATCPFYARRLAAASRRSTTRAFPLHRRRRLRLLPRLAGPRIPAAVDLCGRIKPRRAQLATLDRRPFKRAVLACIAPSRCLFQKFVAFFLRCRARLWNQHRRYCRGFLTLLQSSTLKLKNGMFSLKRTEQ